MPSVSELSETCRVEQLTMGGMGQGARGDERKLVGEQKQDIIYGTHTHDTTSCWHET